MVKSPTPFEPAALLGALDLIEAVKVRLDVQGMRRFNPGAYIAIAEYEVGETVRKLRRKERRRLADNLRRRLKRGGRG